MYFELDLLPYEIIKVILYTLELLVISIKFGTPSLYFLNWDNITRHVINQTIYVIRNIIYNAAQIMRVATNVQLYKIRNMTYDHSVIDRQIVDLQKNDDRQQNRLLKNIVYTLLRIEI